MWCIVVIELNWCNNYNLSELDFFEYLFFSKVLYLFLADRMVDIYIKISCILLLSTTKDAVFKYIFKSTV